MEKTFYKTRLRNKGQITVPAEVRQALNAGEGDDLLFAVDEDGHIVVSRARSFPRIRPGFGASAGSAWKRLPRRS